jgi:RHS repeat-associated protein
LAALNLYRFSSKEVHVASGLIYYGRRFYDPNLQRWITQDPIAERGGINLYAYVANDPIGLLDYLGLCDRPTLFSDFLEELKAKLDWAFDQIWDPAASVTGWASDALGSGLDMWGASWGISGLGYDLDQMAEDLYNSRSPAARAGWYDPNSPVTKLANAVVPILINPEMGAGGKILT